MSIQSVCGIRVLLHPNSGDEVPRRRRCWGGLMSFGVSRGWTWIRSWAQRVSKSDNAVVALGTAGVMLFAVGSYAVINPPRRKRDIELDGMVDWRVNLRPQ